MKTALKTNVGSLDSRLEKYTKQVAKQVGGELSHAIAGFCLSVKITYLLVYLKLSHPQLATNRMMRRRDSLRSKSYFLGNACYFI